MEHSPYSILGTKPDLALSVGFLSRWLENPTNENVTRLKRVLSYVSDTVDVRVTYLAAWRDTLGCYSDADFEGCLKTGWSILGVVITYAVGAISWRSQKQAMVNTSTAEAKIVTVTQATKEIGWLNY